MTPTMQEAADEIRTVLGLSKGYRIDLTEDDNLLVIKEIEPTGAFCITKESVASGRYLNDATSMISALMAYAG